MPNLILDKLFSLQGQVAVITGGSGVLGGAIARGLGLAGARVVVLGRNQTRAEAVVKDIIANGGESLAVLADVSDRTQLEIARDAVLKDWGQIDILINAAGGNVPAATITPDATFFDMPHAAFEQVVSLNLVGTLLPSQVLVKQW